MQLLCGNPIYWGFWTISCTSSTLFSEPYLLKHLNNSKRELWMETWWWDLPEGDVCKPAGLCVLAHCRQTERACCWFEVFCSGLGFGRFPNPIKKMTIQWMNAMTNICEVIFFFSHSVEGSNEMFWLTQRWTPKQTDPPWRSVITIDVQNWTSQKNNQT